MRFALGAGGETVRSHTHSTPMTTIIRRKALSPFIAAQLVKLCNRKLTATTSGVSRYRALHANGFHIRASLWPIASVSLRTSRLTTRMQLKPSLQFTCHGAPAELCSLATP